MKLRWIGHSCFLLMSSKGVRVLMDPYKSSIGLNMPMVEADILTMSHDHMDHNNKDAVKGYHKALNKPGKFEENGVAILGIATAHDDKGGAQRGGNVVFKVTADGISICHCGDLGHPLTAEQLEDIGHVDVLLVPVGGFFTIDAKMAAEVVGQVSPRVIIPMHFKVPGLGYPIQGVEPFINLMGKFKKISSTEIELSPGSLAEYSGVAVLGYQ